MITPAIRAIEHVALPQQRVRMKIDNRERGVQGAGFFAHFDQRHTIDNIGVSLDIGRRKGEETDHTQNGQSQQSVDEFAH